MPRAPLAAAALALAALPAARGIELSVCEESWRCKFEHVLGEATYRWDLNPLCRPAGGYVYGGDDNAATAGQTFAWNICGNSSQACSDFTKADAEYESHGAAVQFMQRGRGERTNGGCLRPDNTTCADYTFGGTTCCSTRRCEVVAYNLFTFDVVAPANPAAGGIVLRYSGYPDRNDDNIACPDQANGCESAGGRSCRARAAR